MRTIFLAISLFLSAVSLSWGCASPCIQFNSASSASVAFASNNTAGHAIIVMATTTQAFGTPTATAADTKSNSYSSNTAEACAVSGSTHQCLNSFIALNIGSGANTVTVSSSGTVFNIAIWEFSTVLTTGAIESSTATFGGTAAGGATGVMSISIAAGTVSVSGSNGAASGNITAASLFALKTTGGGDAVFFGMYNSSNSINSITPTTGWTHEARVGSAMDTWDMALIGAPAVNMIPEVL